MKNKAIFICKSIFIGSSIWINVDFLSDSLKYELIYQILCLIIAISWVIIIFKDILFHIKEIKSKNTNHLAFGKYTFMIGYSISVITALILYIDLGSFFK